MRRILPALAVLILAGLLGWFVLTTNARGSDTPVKLGLDLAGGTELVYRAETQGILTDKKGALDALRNVIEERINVFGVAEPLVQIEQSSAAAGAQEDRLLVELPGVTDVKAAVDALGKTPLLEFKLVKMESATTTYVDTGLTGQFVEKADLVFGQTAGSVGGEATVSLTFNEEGAALFEKITGENVGQQLAIFLDGEPLSAPVIQEAISGGTASISGNFTPQEAKELVENINFGALPVPITLVSSASVGPTLGGEAFHAGLLASALGFALVALFMILWYRLPGFVASVALVIYVLITVALIKFIPVTLTASGIAGFILSIGMAVDANVLIFERMKEELKGGKTPHDAAKIGFSRAWPAIRDGHFTMLISAVILFWMGTSLVKGFALVFGLGVIVSLFSAVTITQTFLNAILPDERKGAWKFLLGTGLKS